MTCKVQNSKSFEGKILTDFIERTPGISLYSDTNVETGFDVLFLDLDVSQDEIKLGSGSVVLIASSRNSFRSWLRKGYTNFLEKSRLSYEEFLVVIEKMQSQTTRRNGQEG